MGRNRDDNLDRLAMRIGKMLDGTPLNDCIPALALCVAWGIAQNYPTQEKRWQAWEVTSKFIRSRIRELEEAA